MKSKLYLIKGGQYYNDNYIPKKSKADLRIVTNADIADIQVWSLIDEDNEDRLVGGLYEKLCKDII